LREIEAEVDQRLAHQLQVKVFGVVSRAVSSDFERFVPVDTAQANVFSSFVWSNLPKSAALKPKIAEISKPVAFGIPKFAP
jgi:hypothetical protein